MCNQKVVYRIRSANNSHAVTTTIIKCYNKKNNKKQCTIIAERDRLPLQMLVAQVLGGIRKNDYQKKKMLLHKICTLTRGS